MLGDSLSELVVLLTFDFLASDDLLETVELLVEFLDHDLVLFEGGFGFFVFGEQTSVGLLDGVMLLSLLGELALDVL